MMKMLKNFLIAFSLSSFLTSLFSLRRDVSPLI
jgi:hypothetical protein